MVVTLAESQNEEFNPMTENELLAIMREMEADAVSVPNVDFSTEAMYERMPGE